MNIFLLVCLLIAVLVLTLIAVKAIGGNLVLVDDWRRAWKFYSVWAYALIGALPDIYNTVNASGLLQGGDAPEQLTWAVRIAAIAGLLLRLIKQYKPPIPDDTDQAGA